MSTRTGVWPDLEDHQTVRKLPARDPLLLIPTDQLRGCFKEDHGSDRNHNLFKHSFSAREGARSILQPLIEARYQYDELPTSDHYVRLIRIDSAPDDEKGLRLTVRIARLGDMKERYDAISYMWGETTVLRPVWINGKQLDIGSNLWYGLQHILKHGFQHRELWVDAICINQNDTMEKNHQVLHMGNVYRYASRVMVWLGKASETSIIHFPDSAHPKRSDGIYDSADCKELYDRDDSSWHVSCQRDQLRITLNDPYWERVWIVQELALAKEVLIISGDLLITFRCLEDLFNIDESFVVFEEYSERLFGDEDIWDGNKKEFQKVLEIRHNHSTPTLDPLQLHFLLSYCHRFMCEDARDRVYAILSLSNALKELQVDYDCETEELLIQVLQCLLLRVQNGNTYKLDTTIVGLVMEAMDITPASFADLLHRRSLSTYRHDTMFELILSGDVLYPHTQDQTFSFMEHIYHSFKFHDFEDIYIWYERRKTVAQMEKPDPALDEDTGVILCQTFGMTDILLTRSIDNRILVRYFVYQFEPSVNSSEQSIRKSKPMDEDILVLFENRLNGMYKSWSGFYNTVTMREKVHISCTALELLRFIYWRGWPHFKIRRYHSSSPVGSDT